MHMHPGHHLQDEQGGDTRHDDLEDVLAVAFKQAREAEHRRSQKRRRRQPCSDAGPQEAAAGFRGRTVGMVDQPGVQDPDDKQRLNALAANDDGDLSE
jgi:hypothetical protein